MTLHLIQVYIGLDLQKIWWGFGGGLFCCCLVLVFFYFNAVFSNQFILVNVCPRLKLA